MKKQVLAKTPYFLLEKVTDIYIALMISVFLLFSGTNGYAYMLQEKSKLFFILCGGYICVVFFLALELYLIGSIKLGTLQKVWKNSSLVQKAVFAYMCITWISAFLSPYYPNTLIGFSRNEGAVTISIYCLCFLFVSVFGRVRKWMLWLLVAAVILFDTLCLIQFTGANPFTLYPTGMNYHDAFVLYSGQYLGTIGNVDFVAAFMCIVVPVLWIAAVKIKNMPQKILLLGTLFLTLVVVWKMWVLAAIVGLALGGILAIPVVIPVSKKAKITMWITIALLLVSFVLVLVFVDFKSGLLYELHQILHGNISGDFGSGRIRIWREVLSRVPERLWLGYGPDTMLLVSNASGNMLLANRVDVAHNEYLNILFHQGIFALSAYMLALVVTAYQWIKHSNKDSIISILGGGILCYCVQAFFGISICITAPFFWLVLALLDNRTRLLTRRRE